MTLTEITSGTAAAGLTRYDDAAVRSGTRALSLRADYLRSDVDYQVDEVHTLHGEARELDLRDRALEKGKNSTSTLLEELSSQRGMGWADIAAVVGVSVSAVRKWRHGGDASPERRAALARLASFLDLIEEKGLVQEPAQWMEMALPLPPGYLIRPIDLYVEGAVLPLLDMAEHRMPLEQALDEARPDWRDQRSAFEVFSDDDGQRSLRLRAE